MSLARVGSCLRRYVASFSASIPISIVLWRAITGSRLSRIPQQSFPTLIFDARYEGTSRRSCNDLSHGWETSLRYLRDPGIESPSYSVIRDAFHIREEVSSGHSLFAADSLDDEGLGQSGKSSSKYLQPESQHRKDTVPSTPQSSSSSQAVTEETPIENQGPLANVTSFEAEHAQTAQEPLSDDQLRSRQHENEDEPGSRGTEDLLITNHRKAPLETTKDSSSVSRHKAKDWMIPKDQALGPKEYSHVKAKLQKRTTEKLAFHKDTMTTRGDLLFKHKQTIKAQNNIIASLKYQVNQHARSYKDLSKLYKKTISELRHPKPVKQAPQSEPSEEQENPAFQREPTISDEQEIISDLQTKLKKSLKDFRRLCNLHEELVGFSNELLQESLAREKRQQRQQQRQLEQHLQDLEQQPQSQSQPKEQNQNQKKSKPSPPSSSSSSSSKKPTGEKGSKVKPPKSSSPKPKEVKSRSVAPPSSPISTSTPAPEPILNSSPPGQKEETTTPTPTQAPAAASPEPPV